MKKFKIKSFKDILKNKEGFEKLKDFFTEHKNSLETLNHALVSDGIILEVDDNYFFKKPLIIYNFFDIFSKKKIINNKFFISLGNNSKLDIIDYSKSQEQVKYFNNTVHNYFVKKNSILK